MMIISVPVGSVSLLLFSLDEKKAERSTLIVTCQGLYVANAIGI